MKVIRARNPHQALFLGMRDIMKEGVRRDSRNGPVLMFPEPVTTVYERPLERVVFYPERDCHPFFHFFESLWMLAGHRDVAFLSQFVPRMKEFSDNGLNFHGAYGFRWRQWFAIDQLGYIADRLRVNKDDRRQVLTMWDGTQDLIDQTGKDYPCNLQVLFQISVDGRLDMTVTNRSNDMLWGAYGANAVHFSYLQEYMAASVGVPVGRYYQVSNNLHVYTKNEVFDRTVDILQSGESGSPYVMSQLTLDPYPINNGVAPEGMEDWLHECEEFVKNPTSPGIALSPFFRRVASPMWKTWCEYKDKENPARWRGAMDQSRDIKDLPWRIAVHEWLQRRLQKVTSKS